MPSALRTLLLSAVVTLGVVGAGTVAAGPEPRSPAGGPPVAAASTGSSTSPSVGELETRGLAVVRAPFCSGVGAEAVVAALGGPPRTTEAWANGETARLTPATTDVAHEHGCRWSTTRATASAWVFAPPVTRARAAALGRSAAQQPGCTAVAGAPAFGSSSTALVCRQGRRTEVSHRGLFGDAWLVCSLDAEGRTGPQRLLARADRWCGAVVTAATGATSPG